MELRDPFRDAARSLAASRRLPQVVFSRGRLEKVATRAGSRISPIAALLRWAGIFVVAPNERMGVVFEQNPAVPRPREWTQEGRSLVLFVPVSVLALAPVSRLVVAFFQDSLALESEDRISLANGRQKISVK